MNAIKDLREIADVVKEAADFLGTIVEQLPRQPLVDELGGCAHWLRETAADLERPIDMVLHCPKCGEQHIDAAETDAKYAEKLHESSWWELGGDKPERWTNPPHRTHLCHSCGHRWRPADVATNGVAAVKTRGKDDDPIVDLRDVIADAERMRWILEGNGYFMEENYLRGSATDSAERNACRRVIDEARGAE